MAQAADPLIHTDGGSANGTLQMKRNLVALAVAAIWLEQLRRMLLPPDTEVDTWAVDLASR
jgi:hypothetical protein